VYKNLKVIARLYFIFAVLFKQSAYYEL